MDKLMYMMIEKTKTYNKITKKVVEEHVENISWLACRLQTGKIIICYDCEEKISADFTV